MKNILSLLLYICVYALAAYFLKISKRRKDKKLDIFFWFAILIPVVIAALRYDVGTDYFSYVSIYTRVSRISVRNWLMYNISFDSTPLGLYICAKIASIFNSVEVFFGLMGFVTIFPVFFIVKKQCLLNDIFIIAFAYQINLFTTSFNMVKQAAAIAIVLFGIEFIYSRKFKQFFICVMIAMMFHVTAAISLPMYFLWRKPKEKISIKRYAFYIGMILVVAFFPSLVQFLPGRFAGYATYEGTSGNRTIWLLFIFLIVFYIFRRRFKVLNINNDVLISIFVIGFILGLTGFVSPYVKRVAMYYTNVQYLLIGQIPSFFVKSNRLIIKSVIMIYLIGYFILSSFVLGQGDVIPYQIGG